MSTGPWHYAEAERLLTIATEVGREITATREDPRWPGEARVRRDDLGKQATGLFARAQVHATLALAAATATHAFAAAADPTDCRPFDLAVDWLPTIGGAS